MVTADDEQTTDIIVEGDKEEIERFWKVRAGRCPLPSARLTACRRRGWRTMMPWRMLRWLMLWQAAPASGCMHACGSQGR